jgi:tape measure domain-containing protein
MALNMDAVLRIVAKVDGTNALQRLGAELSGIGQKAGATLSPFGQMKGALRGVADVAATVGLVTLGRDLLNAGIEAQAASVRINALAKSYGEVDGVTEVAARAAKQFALGNVEAQNAVTDLYGRLRPMGVSLKDIETVFFGVNKAARQVGLSTYDTSEVLLQLSQALGSGALQGDELRSIMERMPAIGQAIAKVMGVSASQIKKLGSEGKITTAVMIQAAAELQKIVPPPPPAVMKYEKALADLRTTLGERLLPVLTPFIEALTGALIVFTKLPAPIQTTAVALGALALAAGPVASVITGIGNALMLLGSLQIGATIAGWLGAVGPAVVAIKAALGGLLAWIGGTLVPGLLAFFSGPIGWTVLAVAAVVAMAYMFREPLMQFVSWLWEWGEPIREFWAGLWNGLVDFVGFSLETVGTVISTAANTWFTALQAVWSTIATAFTTYVTDPISQAWTTVMEFMPTAMESLASAVQGIWTTMTDNIKSVVRSMLQYIANTINSVIELVNYVIRGYNSIPVAGDIPQLGYVTVPAFAEGGTVNRPTLAMVGEGGEREYIVPESKMATASSRFLTGSRGADVIPSSSGGGSSSRAPVINITTGPVLEFDGQRYVRMEDLEKAMRVTADGVIGRLRTPAARIALGRA